MYVLVTERVVKVSTGSTERFAPRTANRQRYTVSGPFGRRAAQQAALAALATHTCLSAQIVSATAVDEMLAKGYATCGIEKYETLREAQRLFAGITAPADAP